MKVDINGTSFEVLEYHTFQLDLAIEAVLRNRLLQIWSKDKAAQIVETEAHDILPELLDELTSAEWYYIFSMMFIPELTPEQFKRLDKATGDEVKKKLRQNIDLQAGLNRVLHTLRKPLTLYTASTRKSIRNKLLLWLIGRCSSLLKSTAEPQKA